MSELYNIPTIKSVSKSELGLPDSALVYLPIPNKNFNNNINNAYGNIPYENPEESDEDAGILNSENAAVNEDEQEVIENPTINDYESNPGLFR